VADLDSWIASLPAGWREGCSEAIWRSAFEAYRSPGRVYHGWSHVESCLEILREFPCERPRAVFLALLFHDAVYIPGSANNEALSAELARVELGQHSTLGEAEIEDIARMIEATKSHHVPAGESGIDLAATLDIDMSILAAPRAQYEAYAAGVRREYCPLVTTESRFVVGRSAFLAGLLREPAIYNTPEGARRWEAAARANIARELTLLRAEQGPFARLVSSVMGRLRH
jgi:predicted metal-dependent HD superfamily phosphohydrolase